MNLRFKENLENEKIGDLLVLKLHHVEEGLGELYYCICQKCNTPILLSRKELTSGTIKDCGCSVDKFDYTDILELPFTRLTPKSIKYKKGSNVIYDCQCACGNPTLIPASRLDLIYGKKKSCGCMIYQITGYDPVVKKPTQLVYGGSNYDIGEYHKLRNYYGTIMNKKEANLYIDENGTICNKKGIKYPFIRKVENRRFYSYGKTEN